MIVDTEFNAEVMANAVKESEFVAIDTESYTWLMIR